MIWFVLSFADLFQDDLCASKFMNCRFYSLIVAEFLDLFKVDLWSWKLLM